MKIPIKTSNALCGLESAPRLPLLARFGIVSSSDAPAGAHRRSALPRSFATAAKSVRSIAGGFTLALALACLFLFAATTAQAAGEKVLLIYDTLAGDTPSLKAYLQANGCIVTYSAAGKTGYNGTNPSPTGFNTIILLNGTTYGQVMPAGGRTALLNFVSLGGGYIGGEWTAYDIDNVGVNTDLAPITPLTRTSSQSTPIINPVAGQSAHPVLAGVAFPMSAPGWWNVGGLRTFATNPAVALAIATGGSVAVATRQYGNGKVVGFGSAGNYTSGVLSNANVQRLYLNAVRWTSGTSGNTPPIANAGPSRSVFDTDNNDVSTVVTLNGSASSDPEGATLTYSWTQIPTATVALTGANTPMPTFTAPDLHNHPSGQPQPIPLTFRLVVSDGSLTSAANVTITVVHNNLPPVANASATISQQDEGTITLNGQLSTDADQDSLSYTWATGAPGVVITPNGTNAFASIFNYTINAPHSNPGETLGFTLTVSDGIASSSTPVPVFVRNVNHAPTASAAPVDPVFDNVGLVSLSGEGLDSDGDTVNLHWVQVAGPSVTLNADTTATPSFTAPPVTTAQGSVTLTFQLIANDSNGPGDTAALSSLPASVDVLVKHANRAPIADAGQTRDVPEQSSVTLDGSGSYDPDQDPLTYAWQQVGTQTVTLDVTDPVHPTFTAPNVGPAGETLTFRLIVTDTAPIGSGGNLSSSPSTVVINVKYVNQSPVAVAAATPPANEGSIVTLDGSQSSDPDGNAFTYQWTPSAGLDLTDPAHPTFTAPEVDRFGGTATFTLQVTDEFGAVSNVATTSVVINNVNHAPTADAGLLQSVPENTAIGLGGLGYDLDSEEQPLLTYAWVQVGPPTVTLVGADTPTPTFTTPTVTAGGDPNASVTLKFKLTVTDPNNASGSAETTVVVKNEDHAPLANAGGISVANEATVVTLNGNGSSDPDGDTLSYSWQQVPAPLVPMVTLSNANTATPSFTAPFVNAAGLTLKFRLTVNDGYGGTSTDTATVTVVNTNDAPTLSNPQASLGSLWAPDHRLVKVSILGVVDPNNNATITITGVTQDEATNGLGDGDTAIDAIINADGTVMLRAERSGKGNGRVYHIHFTASDPESQALGTSVSGIVKVSVPHSKKTDAAIDGGELFDSTH